MFGPCGRNIVSPVREETAHAAASQLLPCYQQQAAGATPVLHALTRVPAKERKKLPFIACALPMYCTCARAPDMALQLCQPVGTRLTARFLWVVGLDNGAGGDVRVLR